MVLRRFYETHPLPHAPHHSPPLQPPHVIPRSGKCAKTRGKKNGRIENPRTKKGYEGAPPAAGGGPRVRGRVQRGYHFSDDVIPDDDDDVENFSFFFFFFRVPRTRNFAQQPWSSFPHPLATAKKRGRGQRRRFVPPPTETDGAGAPPLSRLGAYIDVAAATAVASALATYA